MDRLNRRSFFGMVLGTLGFLAIPFTYKVRSQPKKDVQRLLTLSLNDFLRGYKFYPVTILASSNLYDDFSSSIQCLQRFTETEATNNGFETLNFKSSTMYRLGYKGYKVIYIQGDRRKTYDLSNWQPS